VVSVSCTWYLVIGVSFFVLCIRITFVLLCSFGVVLLCSVVGVYVVIHELFCLLSVWGDLVFWSLGVWAVVLPCTLFCDVELACPVGFPDVRVV